MRAALMIALCALGVTACSSEGPDVGQLDVSPTLDVSPAADADGDPDAVGFDGDAAVVCSCEGLECGDNPCGESCGTCPAAAPFCHDHVCYIDCQPSCGDAVCGDDGCGGECGTCDAPAVCVDGACGCEPACDDRVCGDDGCGGNCGACGELEACRDGVCGPCSCDGLECGDSGCGLDCGACPEAAPYCVDNVCAITCTPACDDRVCGDDGCGGSCGACPEGASCESGVCVGCPCDGIACGDNACGEPCGTCAEPTPNCVAGQCVAEPPPCPTAVIEVTPGTNVGPGTKLELSGTNSLGVGPIAAWEWSVDVPGGWTGATFSPDAQDPTPTFYPYVVGTYTFSLQVVDSFGTPSCQPATVTVDVTTDAAIYVELTWTTPGDADETDTGFIGSRSAGSDLDLHFIHPLAVDPANPEGWFHSRYDVYWANSSPDWNGPGADDDPKLHRDDTDGAGPESLSLDLPESGWTYKVGVHYWDDWNYGDSFATIRVFIHGQQRLQWNHVKLENVTAGSGDMWECCTISWPSGAVSKIEVGGSGTNVPFIRPAYSEPSQFPF